MSSWKKKHADEKKQQPHASVVLLTEAGRFVEDERNSEVRSKEEQKRQEKCEHEVPQRELIEHAKDVSTQQHRDQNETLRAGTSTVKQPHPCDEQAATGEGRDGENGDPREQKKHPASMNPRMRPKETHEGIIANELCCKERDEQGRIGHQRHRRGGKVLGRQCEASQHHDGPAHTQHERHTQGREAEGGSMRPRPCIHPWHGRYQQQTERPKQPRGRKQAQRIECDGEIRNREKMPAPNTVAACDAPLKLRGHRQNDQHGEGVAQKGIDQRRAVKPAVCRTGLGHPVVTSQGQGEQRKRPKHQHGVEPRELTFRKRKNRDDPRLPLRQFSHPAQPVQVGVEADEVAMDVIVG